MLIKFNVGGFIGIFVGNTIYKQKRKRRHIDISFSLNNLTKNEQFCSCAFTLCKKYEIKKNKIQNRYFLDLSTCEFIVD